VSRATTRRRFLQATAATAAGVAAGDLPAFAQRPDGPNLILVIVDSLRADAVYDRAVATPNIDELVFQGLHFTSAYPEAMPTVPARNSILGGRRTFPFRHWHDYPGLLDSPGWAPLRHVDDSLPAVLRRAGYWTAYVTDNPFLGFARPYAPLRHSVNSFVRTGGEIGGSHPISSVPKKVLRHWMHPAIYPEKRERVGKYLANSRYWHDDIRSFAAKVMKDAVHALDVGAWHRPFALIVDTYEPHEPWTPPPPYANLYGKWRGPEPAMPLYGKVDNWLAPSQRGPVVRRLRELYAAEVTMTDRWLGILFDRLHELNLERDTVIALVSDHGILLGEHGWTGKISTALHPALTRIPLVVVDPARRQAAQSSRWFASTHDLAPTLLSMMGVQAPGRMNGVDMSPLFDGKPLPKRDYAFGGYGNSFFIRTRRWALWGRNKPARFHLFDRHKDPSEGTNVAHRHHGVAGHLYGIVRKRAGGKLPYYKGLDPDG
jgi:arylsulfatase A-like enzyme